MSRRLRHYWLTLACLGIGLLALLPTLGRLHESTQSSQWRWQQAMQAQGMALCVSPASPQPAPGGQAHPDCDYCTLLTGLLCPVAANTTLPPAPLNAGGEPYSSAPRHGRVHASLGARGPPQA
ncbi:MAG: hypothetical protein Q4B94_02095 [Pseudomonadota bacterium]|nr:hypothetical protein [Pseudomonadota bacterium]